MAASEPKRRIRIVDGPSEKDLMIALFDPYPILSGTEHGPRTVEFLVEAERGRRIRIDVEVSSSQRGHKKDDSFFKHAWGIRGVASFRRFYGCRGEGEPVRFRTMIGFRTSSPRRGTMRIPDYVDLDLATRL